MFGRNRITEADDELDKLARNVILAAAIDEDEAASAIESPFAYPRLRARIEEERNRRGAPLRARLAVVIAARRAFPAMALVAMAAVGLFWYSTRGSPAEPITSGFAGIDLERTAPVSACSISTKTECVVSTEEVLATMMDRREKETPR